MKLRNILFATIALLFAACGDDEPEQNMVPGGVDVITESGVTKANGQTFTMPQNAESMEITLGSRGLDAGSLTVLEADRGMAVDLVDPFNPDKLTVYDKIEAPDGKFDNLYEQKIKITAAPYQGNVADFKERKIKIRIVPIGGYNVYSIITVVSPKPTVN